MASVSNSSRLDTLNSLRVQRSTSNNLQGVVAPNSRRKVKSATRLHGREQVCRADRRYVASPGCWSAGTVHAQRQVPRKRLAESSGVGAGPGPGFGWGCPGPRCGLLGGSLLVGGATWATSTCTAISGLGAGMWYWEVGSLGAKG